MVVTKEEAAEERRQTAQCDTPWDSPDFAGLRGIHRTSRDFAGFTGLRGTSRDVPDVTGRAEWTVGPVGPVWTVMLLFVTLFCKYIVGPV